MSLVYSTEKTIEVESHEKPFLSAKYLSALNLNVDDEHESLSRSTSHLTISNDARTTYLEKGMQSLVKIKDETQFALEQSKNRISSLQQQVEYYKEVKEKDDETITKQAAEIQALRKQFSNFSAQVEDLARENGKLVKETSCSNVDITKLKLEINRLNEAFQTELHETINQYEDDIKFKDSLIKSLKNQLDELCGELKLAKEDINQKEVLYARSEQEIARLTELLTKFTPSNNAQKGQEAIYEMIQQELNSQNTNTFQKLVKKLKLTKKKIETKHLNGKLQPKN